MVTPEEQRAIQEENAKHDERFWGTMRDLNASSIQEHRALIARAEAKIAEQEPEVAKAAERAEAAKSRLEKIRRGEDVAGGLGKPVKMKPMLKAAGKSKPTLMISPGLSPVVFTIYDRLRRRIGIQRRRDIEYS
jgi:septal ring factor EnvC (AmiA/AmiB activator)